MKKKFQINIIFSKSLLVLAKYLKEKCSRKKPEQESKSSSIHEMIHHRTFTD